MTTQELQAIFTRNYGPRAGRRLAVLAAGLAAGETREITVGKRTYRVSFALTGVTQWDCIPV